MVQMTQNPSNGYTLPAELRGRGRLRLRGRCLPPTGFAGNHGDAADALARGGHRLPAPDPRRANGQAHGGRRAPRRPGARSLEGRARTAFGRIRYGAAGRSVATGRDAHGVDGHGACAAAALDERAPDHPGLHRARDVIEVARAGGERQSGCGHPGSSHLRHAQDVRMARAAERGTDSSRAPGDDGPEPFAHRGARAVHPLRPQGGCGQDGRRIPAKPRHQAQGAVRTRWHRAHRAVGGRGLRRFHPPGLASRWKVR
jgi:hypothetical protein